MEPNQPPGFYIAFAIFVAYWMIRAARWGISELRILWRDHRRREAKRARRRAVRNRTAVPTFQAPVGARHRRRAV